MSRSGSRSSCRVAWRSAASPPTPGTPSPSPTRAPAPRTCRDAPPRSEADPSAYGGPVGIGTWAFELEKAYDRARSRRAGDRTPRDFRIVAYGGHGGAAGVVVRGR